MVSSRTRKSIRTSAIFLAIYSADVPLVDGLTNHNGAAICALETWLRSASSLRNDAIAHWLAVCRSEVATRVEHVPVRPPDYRRPAKLSCDCQDCRELSAFLDDPEEAVHRFRVNENRRGHLHRIIERHHCDVTHATERKSRPYTLVCTKTTASYDEACRVHERDQQFLSRLEALEQQG